MKKLIALVSLLLLTLPTFCQIGIVTQSGDSLIALPKKTVILMIKDIVQGDGYKSETILLNSKINKLDTQIQLQDSITTVLQSKCIDYKSTIDKYVVIDKTYQDITQNLNKTNIRLRKQRNTLGYFAVALLVGLLTK
jgi:hypothetical protein